MRPQHAPVLRVRHGVAALSPLKPAAAIAGLLRLDQQLEIRRLKHAPAIGKRMQDSFCKFAVLTHFCTQHLSASKTCPLLAGTAERSSQDGQSLVRTDVKGQGSATSAHAVTQMSGLHPNIQVRSEALGGTGSDAGALVSAVLHGREATEHDVVGFGGQLVLDGAILGATQHVLCQQCFQLALGSLSLWQEYCSSLSSQGKQLP